MIRLTNILKEDVKAYKPSDYTAARRAVSSVAGSKHTLKLYVRGDKDWLTDSQFSKKQTTEIEGMFYSKGTWGGLDGYAMIDMETRRWQISLDSGMDKQGKF